MKPAIVVILIILLAIGGYFILDENSVEIKPVETPSDSEQQEADTPDAIPAPDDVAAMPADVELTEKGVGIRFITEGDGETFPSLTDNVTVHYTGWTTDGVMFDSSRLREEPNTFPLGLLIEGWQDALPHMSVGSHALIWIPGALAYDNRPDRPNAPKGMLVFDIELLAIEPGDSVDGE